MKFLQGTYGFDLLSIFLIFISIIFNISDYTKVFGIIITIIVIYRAFSKNIYKRSQELNKFTLIMNKFLGKFGKRLPEYRRVSLDMYAEAFKNSTNILNNYIKERKQYKIVKCPKCSQKLRLPRGKGSIIVTCKRCNNEFKLKT